MDFFQKNKLLIAILSVVFLVCGITLTAIAIDYLQQTGDNVSLNPRDGQDQRIGQSLNYNPLTGERFLDLSGKVLNNITIKVSGTDGASCHLMLVKHSFDPGTEKCIGGYNRYGYVKKISIPGDGIQVINFNNYILDNGCFSIKFYKERSQYWQVYGSNIDNYLYGTGYTADGSFNLITLDDPYQPPATSMKDVYFITDLELPPLHNDEIEITSPVISAPGDFENWEITFDTATTTTATTTDAYVAYIYAGYSSSTAIQELPGDAGAGLVHSFQSPKLIKNHAVYGEGSLYAHAKLFYQPDRFFNPDLIQQVATSSVINFTITPTSYAMSFYPTPTSVATSSEWVFTCDPESGFFANSLCNMFRFVFVPTTASVNRFGDLGDTIKSKPPFGYWGKIKDEIQDINATAPAFVLAGASVLAENTIFINIRTMTSILLWFLFGFWILHRIRKFNF